MAIQGVIQIPNSIIVRKLDATHLVSSILPKKLPVQPPKVPATPPESTTQSIPSQLEPHVKVVGAPVTKEQVKQVLLECKDQYMKAMHTAKSKGDESGHKQYGLVAVIFERAIKDLDQGQHLNFTGILLPPPGFRSKYNIDLSQYKSTPPTTASQSSIQISARRGQRSN